MIKKLILLAVFVLLFPTLVGCMPVGTRVSSPDAGTPIIQMSPVQIIPSPTNTATALIQAPTAIPATTTSVPPSATPLPVVNVATVSWQSFTSPNYHYTIAYPSDWTVLVENPGTMGEARQVERVIFKQPNYGQPNQFSTVTIEAAQHGYSMTGQCQNQTEVVPGIKGCRRSMPKAQNPAQELVWFHPPETAGQLQPYFYVQLVYDDLKHVATLAHMLTTFKYRRPLWLSRVAQKKTSRICCAAAGAPPQPRRCHGRVGMSFESVARISSPCIELNIIWA